jgi:hypothetical protein
MAKSILRAVVRVRSGDLRMADTGKIKQQKASFKEFMSHVIQPPMLEYRTENMSGHEEEEWKWSDF